MFPSRKMLLLLVLCGTACGEDEKAPAEEIVDMEVPMDMADVEPVSVSFIPNADPVLPGSHAIFAEDRIRCQLVLDTRNEAEERLSNRRVWTYDGAGNLILDEMDEDGNGVVDRRISRTFDGPNKLLRAEEDTDGDTLPDAIVILQYSEADLVEILYDTNADGVVERKEIQTFSDGRLIEERLVDVTDGQTLSRVSFSYDEDGRLVQVEEFDGEDMAPRYRLTNVYDEMGRLTSTDQDFDGNGDSEVTATYVYDDDARSTILTSEQSEPAQRSVAVSQYDDGNRLIERQIDIGADNSVESVVRYEYSGEQLTAVEREENQETLRDLYRYDRYGRVVSIQLDEDGASPGTDKVIDVTHHCRSELESEGE